MNVITFASRKGGAGKSTLTAHLAAFAHQTGHRCLLVDADPQGSLTLWHAIRADRQPPLQNAARGIDRLVTFLAAPPAPPSLEPAPQPGQPAIAGADGVAPDSALALAAPH